MWKQSVWTSAIAAALAAKHLKDGGIVTLPGAQPALEGTAGKGFSSCISEAINRWLPLTTFLKYHVVFLFF